MQERAERVRPRAGVAEGFLKIAQRGFARDVEFGLESLVNRLIHRNAGFVVIHQEQGEKAVFAGKSQPVDGDRIDDRLDEFRTGVVWMVNERVR